MLLTNDVEIIGKKLNKKIFKPFSSIDELITYKNSMKKPPNGNVPIKVTKTNNTIFVSGRLCKSGRLSHDPNIGALSIISATLRKLNWQGKIIITKHGLKQKHLGNANKFIFIANQIRILLDNLSMPQPKLQQKYWKYDKSGEKLGTIFIHLVIESFTNGYSIYENHAGCERGYFLSSSGEHIAIKKYINREKYKAGDKSKIINLPDLIILDTTRKQIINIEGEMYENKHNGVKQIMLFDSFEDLYVKPSYPNFSIIRRVVLYGGSNKSEKFEVRVGFVLSEDGGLILGIKAPKIFKDAITRLIDFWR